MEVIAKIEIKIGVKMGKYKYLFKNIGIMTISNFGTKILSF